MFWNKGNWVDVEKHVADIELVRLGAVFGVDKGVVVFQKNDKTNKRRAVLKVQGMPDKVMDSDIAEMKLGISVKWDAE